MNSSPVDSVRPPETRKVALITGSGRGIGLEIARAFGSEGYSVVLSDINAETLESARKTLAESGMKVAAFVGNVSRGDEAEKLVEQTVSTFGGLDVLVNNAGITRDGLVMRMTDEAWDQVMSVNLRGTFLMSRAAVKVMLKARKGTIISIASVIGLMGNAGQANYAASKAGIIAFTKSLAKEFGKRGITANAIAPGFIKSEMTDVLPDKVKEQMLEQIPLSRFGLPSDVANIATFLASEKAAYITGQVITVDGGMVMY